MSARSKLLWIEDEPDVVADFQSGLDAAGVPIEIELAEDSEEAEECLAELSHYCGAVFDCNLAKQHDSGASLLRETNDRYPFFPTFVYTAFSADRRFQHDLNASIPRWIVSKAHDFNRPYTDDPHIAELIQTCKSYDEIRECKPEDITFREYQESPSTCGWAFKEHWKKHGYWIEQCIARNGYAWVVVCGTQIALSGVSAKYPRREELVALGAERNVIPFFYSAAPVIESVAWSDTKLPEGDRYPTIRVILDDEEVVGDLDTGASATFVSDEMFQPMSFAGIRSHVHLGQAYDFSACQVSCELVGGYKGPVEMNVHVVSGWQASPFVKVNPDRRVLVGRDFLRLSGEKVILDGENGETRVGN